MTSEFPARLIDGYRDFLAGRMATERERYRELARRGQSPAIMVIGCCDSRVSPEVIFDAHPGELFVVRNIANLVPAYTSDGLCHGVFAALEFAVQVLKVRHIVVLGHARWGAPLPRMGRHCRLGIQSTSGCRSLRPQLNWLARPMGTAIISPVWNRLPSRRA